MKYSTTLIQDFCSFFDESRCKDVKYRQTVLRILIQVRRIHLFLDLPDQDPLVRDMDLDPSTIMQNSKKNIYSYCFVTSL